MKIIFLCGCLEKGKDGVGDYTRRLTEELISRGNRVAIIALQDHYVDGVIQEKPDCENSSPQVLRIGHGISAKKRSSEAIIFINKQDPEWLSLQYVPFSFQKLGLPFFLGEQLKKIGEGRKWHIMFHELWVGMDKESPWKHKLWGQGQVYIVKKIIDQLSPVIIHTQTPLYKAQLKRIGYEACLLPLFGNIPVHFSPKRKAGRQKLSFVIFGLIQPGAPIEQFARDLANYGRNIKKEIHFTFIGRNGEELRNWVKVCIKNNFKTILFGEQEVSKISKVLSEADWGISSTPAFQIEKSSTVASMRDHDLPVYCVSRPWNTSKVPKIDLPDGIKEYRCNGLDLTVAENSGGMKNRLENVTRSFMSDLL